MICGEITLKPGCTRDMNIFPCTMPVWCCAKKKMYFFKPTAYIHYVPAKLHDTGDVWYISYYVINPSTGKLKRMRLKLNHIKPVRERKKAAKAIMTSHN